MAYNFDFSYLKNGSPIVTLSSFGIAFGFPLLLLVNFAAGSTTNALITLGIAAVYMGVLMLLMFKVGKGKKKKQ